jgi:D-hydroxyproline dehydrogenase subunit gamma
MPENVAIHINGTPVQMPAGSVVSAAILKTAIPSRRSVSGEPRSALCGMGICFECCAKVNGIPHRRTCQLICSNGMVVETER